MRVHFTPNGWKDYQHWLATNIDLAFHINELIEDARRRPFTGLGKPEPLRHELAGWWARRITKEHRLVYRVQGKGDDQFLEIAACQTHYRKS